MTMILGIVAAAAYSGALAMKPTAGAGSSIWVMYKPARAIALT